MRRHLFDGNYSLKILIGMLAILMVVSGLLFHFKEGLMRFYLEDQLDQLGVFVNGGIVVLFLLGVLQLIAACWRNWREENALALFTNNFEQAPSRPLLQVDPSSLIADRYVTLEQLKTEHAVINHSAMAQILVARESEYLRIPRFINNILILSGVFGTIVSLSFALVGASDVLGSLDNIDGMGQVIDGMSTALSTTITAIACYVLFGFFLQQVSGAQTRLLAAIERITHDLLLPQFQNTTEGVNAELNQLIDSLRQVASLMNSHVEGGVNPSGDQEDLRQTLLDSFHQRDRQMAELRDDLNGLKRVLIRGFRLPDDVAP